MSERALLGSRPKLLNRRSFLIGTAVSLGGLGLAGCASHEGMSLAEAQVLYGPVPREKFPIPAADINKLDPKYFRRTVRYETEEAPGTIIVDPGNYYVYRVEGEGNATRYGANVGRDGVNAGGILQRQAGVKVQHGRKQEGPRYRGPSCLSRFIPEGQPPTAVLTVLGVTGAWSERA